MDPVAEKYYSHTPYKYAMNNPIVFVDPNGLEDLYFLVKWYYENNIEVKKVIPFYSVSNNSPDTYTVLHDPTGWNTSYHFGTNKERFDKWASKTSLTDAHIPFPKFNGVGLMAQLLTEGAIALAIEGQTLNEPNLEVALVWQDYMESELSIEMDAKFSFATIVGSFGSLENAEDCINNLREKYDSESFNIIDVGDGKYRVSVGETNSYSNLFINFDSVFKINH